jgi:Family of unknown function (DUF5343)
MADKHPYVSTPGSLVQVINHFRKAFPATVTAETLKKLGFAPANESYVLNVLRFLGTIDQEGKRTDEASKVFNIHDDAKFAEGFSKIVRTAYKELFDLHGEGSWKLDMDALITFFRSADETSAIVGKRQAATFQLLAKFAGHGDVPAKSAAAKSSSSADKPKIKKPIQSTDSVKEEIKSTKTIPDAPVIGLTVRIEINLPADADQETYNRIFKSIRENFLNA